MTLQQSIEDLCLAGDEALPIIADALEESGTYEPYRDGGDFGWWRGDDGPLNASLPVEMFDNLPRKTSAGNQLFASRRAAFLDLAAAFKEISDGKT